jgi:small nuclear ribonucleoprotein (snRNP)-like protein
MDINIFLQDFLKGYLNIIKTNQNVMGWKTKYYIFVTIVLLLLIIPATAAGKSDITIEEIYSDVQSCDVRIISESTHNNLTVEASMLHEGKVIDTQSLDISTLTPVSPLTIVFYWENTIRDDGAYEVQVIVKNEKEVFAQQEKEFVHGHQILPAITIDSLTPTSTGIEAIITPYKSTLVDIEYMLVDGNRVVDIIEEKAIPVHTQPLTLDKKWNVVLKNKHVYQGRLKVSIEDPYSISLLKSRSFVAEEDVQISDIYKDKIGASATISGMSQVPFRGSIRFTVFDSKGKPVENIVRESPVLLAEDEETVEAIWENKLDSGEYTLLIEAIGEYGKVIIAKESIIDVEKEIGPATINEENEEQSNATPAIGSLISIILLFLAYLAKTKY